MNEVWIGILGGSYPVPDDNLDLRLGRLMESRTLVEQRITALSGAGNR